MQYPRWWRRVSIDDWLYPVDDRHRRWWWLVAAALGVVFVLMPFIDERLHPPFGRYWPWTGGSPLDTAEKLVGGVLLLLFLLIVVWAMNPNRRRPERE